jgi:hypothetical protein
LKKHGTRRSGTGSPATRAWTQTIAYRPVASASVTALIPSDDRIPLTARCAAS